LSDLKSTS